MKIKYAKTTITLGILVALMPFLGFPGLWKTIFFVISGFVISALSFSLLLSARNLEPKEQKDKKENSDNNVDNQEEISRTPEITTEAHE